MYTIVNGSPKVCRALKGCRADDEGDLPKKEPPGVRVRGFGQEHRPERKKPMRLCRILPQAASACDKLSKCPPVPPLSGTGRTGKTERTHRSVSQTEAGAHLLAHVSGLRTAAALPLELNREATLQDAVEDATPALRVAVCGDFLGVKVGGDDHGSA